METTNSIEFRKSSRSSGLLEKGFMSPNFRSLLVVVGLSALSRTARANKFPRSSVERVTNCAPGGTGRISANWG